MNYRKILVLVGLVLLSSCVRSPKQWKENQKPFEVKVFNGKASVLSECVKQSLSYERIGQYEISRDISSDSIFLSLMDEMNGSALHSAEFKQLDGNKTEVSTRGIEYLFGTIPKQSTITMEAADKCSKQGAK